jgi:hypothetical protein
MSDSNWLDPLNKQILQAAFKKKAPQVTLRDGRIFNLDYNKMPGSVYVTPAFGFVPRGYFDLKRVTDRLWLQQVEPAHAPTL